MRFLILRTSTIIAPTQGKAFHDIATQFPDYAQWAQDCYHDGHDLTPPVEALAKYAAEAYKRRRDTLYGHITVSSISHVRSLSFRSLFFSV